MGGGGGGLGGGGVGGAAAMTGLLVVPLFLPPPQLTRTSNDKIRPNLALFIALSFLYRLANPSLILATEFDGSTLARVARSVELVDIDGLAEHFLAGRDALSSVHLVAAATLQLAR